MKSKAQQKERRANVPWLNNNYKAKPWLEEGVSSGDEQDDSFPREKKSHMDIGYRRVMTQGGIRAPKEPTESIQQS